MQTVLASFQNEILELREHINYITNVSSEINSSSPLSRYVNSITKKRFNYKSLIISLYGIVENYSEKFIIKYLEVISSSITEYSNLKDIIKNQNIQNSATLILKIIDQKNLKYNHLKEIDLITNLYTCVNNHPNYLINYEAFTILSGNLKHSKIQGLFKQVGVDLNSGFILHTDFNLSNTENQFKKLDELVEMRNEIAHGNTSTLLDPSQIEEYVDFIEKYFTNLYKLLLVDLKQEELKYWKNNHSLKLENTKVFNGNIIGFNNIQNIVISNSSLIIVEKSGTPNVSYQTASVLNIKKFPNNDITLKLSSVSNLKDNQQFYIKL
jgi:hypothetical protein